MATALVTGGAGLVSGSIDFSVVTTDFLSGLLVHELYKNRVINTVDIAVIREKGDFMVVDLGGVKGRN